MSIEVRNKLISAKIDLKKIGLLINQTSYGQFSLDELHLIGFWFGLSFGCQKYWRFLMGYAIFGFYLGLVMDLTHLWF